MHFCLESLPFAEFMLKWDYGSAETVMPHIVIPSFKFQHIKVVWKRVRSSVSSRPDRNQRFQDENFLYLHPDRVLGCW